MFFLKKENNRKKFLLEEKIFENYRFTYGRIINNFDAMN